MRVGGSGAGAWFSRFSRFSIRKQVTLATLAALSLVELLTLGFYWVFFADRLLLDLFLSGTITVLVAVPMATFIFRQSAALAEMTEEYRKAATTDSLTGLLNRKHFMAESAEWCAIHLKPPGIGSMLFMDADHFKRLNDTHGHAMGDRVLAAIGAALTKCLWSDGFAGRIGGEEFAAYLPDADLNRAEQVCQRIIRHVAAIGPSLGLASEDVTMSIGIAVKGSGMDAYELLAEADRHLYRAKDDGRNCVRTVFDLDAVAA